MNLTRRGIIVLIVLCALAFIFGAVYLTPEQLARLS